MNKRKQRDEAENVKNIEKENNDEKGSSFKCFRTITSLDLNQDEKMMIHTRPIS